LDVHLNSIVAVWRQVGGTIRYRVVEPTTEGFEELVRAVGAEGVWGAYEASSCGWEAYDELTGLGWKMSVLAPTHLPKSVKGRKRKTDLEDAKMLQEVLMAHGELGSRLPSVWVPNERVRNDREIVRRRLAVAEKLAQVKSEIRSLLRMHRLKVPAEYKTAWTLQYVEWLRNQCGEESGNPDPVRSVLSSQVRELEYLKREVKQLQEEVEALAEQPAYARPVEKMTERVGVGTLTAMTFLLELGDVHRFKNRGQVGSYLGLVPTSYESGDNDNRKGRISRMGPARIRKVLNQAAWSCLAHDPTLKAWYKPLAERRGSKKAIVAVMRRLGIELWRRACSA
jgi:transposase